MDPFDVVYEGMIYTKLGNPQALPTTTTAALSIPNYRATEGTVNTCV